MAGSWLACGPLVRDWSAASTPGPQLSGPTSVSSLSYTAILQRSRDPVVGGLLLAVDAVGIALQQHRHAVPEPPGSFGGRDAGIEHQRRARMPQIVRAPGKRRCCFDWCERCLTRGSPHLAVGSLCARSLWVRMLASLTVRMWLR